MDEIYTPRYELQTEPGKELARRSAYLAWREMKGARITIRICAVVILLSSLVSAWFGETGAYSTLAILYTVYALFYDRFMASNLRRSWKKKSGGTMYYAFR